MGGALEARRRVGGWPSNWHDAAFGARDVRDFLADLDIFLHFPDPSYIEEFGRAPMEAMAMGVPVILPPEFEPTFGPAALYTDAAGVWPLVERLWRDRAAWEARVAAGREFVYSTCGYGVFRERITGAVPVAALSRDVVACVMRETGGDFSSSRSGLAPPEPGFMSVVVPVYRQWALVPVLLEALAAQAFPAERFEVLLVDNESGGDRGDLGRARIVDCAVPGSYAARNAGAAVARGELLVFTDADCRPDPDWLAGFAGARGELLAGPVRMIAPEQVNPWAIYDLIRGIPQAAYVGRGYAATANLAVPAAVFRSLGGFDAGRFSGGDAEFCRRAGRAAHGLTLAPGAVVSHPCRTSWAEVATKARRTKGGQVGAGPLPRRVAWTLRTLAPPLRDLLATARAKAPVRWHLIAAGVRFQVWGVELVEMARLIAGGGPERR